MDLAGFLETINWIGKQAGKKLHQWEHANFCFSYFNLLVCSWITKEKASFGSYGSFEIEKTSVWGQIYIWNKIRTIFIKNVSVQTHLEDRIEKRKLFDLLIVVGKKVVGNILFFLDVNVKPHKIFYKDWKR